MFMGWRATGLKGRICMDICTEGVGKDHSLVDVACLPDKTMQKHHQDAAELRCCLNVTIKQFVQTV